MHSDKVKREKPQFDPVPDGYRVYRTFGDIRVTVSENGHSVGMQFAGGQPPLHVANMLCFEEGFWCMCCHWRREDDKNPRGNLEDIISLAKDLRGCGRDR